MTTNKKKIGNFFDTLTVFLIIGLAIKAFISPNPNFKLPLFFASSILLAKQLTGKAYTPIFILYGIVTIALYLFFKDEYLT
jgi:hypothetical protein